MRGRSRRSPRVGQLLRCALVVACAVGVACTAEGATQPVVGDEGQPDRGSTIASEPGSSDVVRTAREEPRTRDLLETIGVADVLIQPLDGNRFGTSSDAVKVTLELQRPFDADEYPDAVCAILSGPFEAITYIVDDGQVLLLSPVQDGMDCISN